MQRSQSSACVSCFFPCGEGVKLKIRVLLPFYNTLIPGVTQYLRGQKSAYCITEQPTQENAGTNAASVSETKRGKYKPDSPDLMGCLKIQTCQKGTVGIFLQVKSEKGMRSWEAQESKERWFFLFCSSSHSSPSKTSLASLCSLSELSQWILHFLWKTVGKWDSGWVKCVCVGVHVVPCTDMVLDAAVRWPTYTDPPHHLHHEHTHTRTHNPKHTHTPPAGDWRMLWPHFRQ